MKVAAAVLTYQALSHDRVGLMHATIASLREADEIYLVDNGSDDGTERIVTAMGGYCSSDLLTTSGHGTNMQARILAGSDADICVLSDDDMFWRPGWRAKLESWWEAAPDDIALTGCHLEPSFHWNTIVGETHRGGVRALVRHSTGAASWSYRAAHYVDIFGPCGIPQLIQGHGDVPACERLRDRGFRICQIDLADHVGHNHSTWGNLTVDKFGWDVEPVRAMLEQPAEVAS